MKRLIGIAVLAVASLAFAVPAASADDGAIRVVRRAEGLARRAAFHLDEARIDRDVRRTRCHDSVLSQTHAVLRLVRYGVEESEGAQRRTTLLGVLDRRLDELEGDLRTCNGETIGPSSHRTEVTVIVERWVPREDPTVLAERRSLLGR